MVRWGLRALFFTHRWSGIILALLMAVWALSGFVMMYVAYPETTEGERLSRLAPLDLSQCCDAELPDIPTLDSATVEMLGGAPVLRWQGGNASGLLRLTDGSPLEITPQAAGSIAKGYAASSAPAEAHVITRDQWTVSGAFRQHAPLYKVSLADDAGTILYVSGRDGTVVQDTTRHERFWNWLGAVPHWLYFTELRANPPLWSDVVIYASLLGTFLTVTGIYLGIRQYGRGKRRIPYRGLGWWHHVTGLVFGLFTLTWIISGLFSMQPWGWMESGGAGAEVAALAGRSSDQADLDALLGGLRGGVPAGTRSVELAIQGETAFAIMADANGQRTRAALPGLIARPLSDEELRARAASALPGVKIASQEMLRAPDAYYYAHHNHIVLPVWRVIYGNDDKTRLYFNPASGELLRKVDGPARTFRWLHSALHSWDFAPGLRARPVWDIVMIPSMIGVSLVCLIGLWLGIRRLRHSIRRARR